MPSVDYVSIARRALDAMHTPATFEERYEPARPTATCPYCHASVRITPGAWPVVERNGCTHIAHVERFEGTIWVVFRC